MHSFATFILADYVKRNKPSYLVGETTAGSWQSIISGELFFFSMSKSKIKIDIPLIWQRPYQDLPDEGIIPDFPVQTTSEDIAQKRDTQMNFIVNILLKQ